MREGGFTVSYPRPSQVLSVALAAPPRCDDAPKPSRGALPVFPAGSVPGPFLEDAYLHLECKLEYIIDDLETAAW